MKTSFYSLDGHEHKEKLEALSDIIIDEVRKVPKELFFPWHEAKIHNGKWFLCPLKLFEVEYPTAKSILPNTLRILNEMPTIQAGISILKSGAVIYPHSDVEAGEDGKLYPTTGKIAEGGSFLSAISSISNRGDVLISRDSYRMHLGITIPENCELSVMNEDGEYDNATWEEGKVLSFDDSQMHKAYNLSDEDRVVLIVDVPKENVKITKQQKDDIMKHAMRFYGKGEEGYKDLLK